MTANSEWDRACVVASSDSLCRFLENERCSKCSNGTLQPLSTLQPNCVSKWIHYNSLTSFKQFLCSFREQLWTKINLTALLRNFSDHYVQIIFGDDKHNKINKSHTPFYLNKIAIKTYNLYYFTNITIKC